MADHDATPPLWVRLRYCAEPSPAGYLCTCPLGHAGEHVARDTEDHVCDRWPQDDDDVPTA